MRHYLPRREGFVDDFLAVFLQQHEGFLFAGGRVRARQ